MDDLKAIFGQKLNKLRKANGLTLKQLAKKLNISCTSISEYETGDKSPTFERVVLLSKFFKVPIDYFLNPNADISTDPEYETVFYLAKKRKVTAKMLNDIINAISSDEDKEHSENL